MSALGQKQTFRDVQTRSAFTSESGHYSAAVFHKNFARVVCLHCAKCEGCRSNHGGLIIYFLPEWPPSGGHKMAKKKNGVVPLRLVVQRINRKLAAKGQILIKATLWMRMVLHYGDYYILDLNGKVMDTHIDPEKLARKLRVWKDEEEVERARQRLTNRRPRISQKFCEG